MNCIVNNPVYLNVYAAGYTPGVGVQQQSSHTQAQAVLGTYSPMASHQCSMVQVNTEHLKVSFFFFFFHQKRFTKCVCARSNSNRTSFPLCREAYRCPIPRVKLRPQLVGRQRTAAWYPHPPTTAAATPPAAPTSAPPPGARSTDDASADGAKTHVVNTRHLYTHSLAFLTYT